MDRPPHFLLDALKDSIASGTFIDTKFYVFSRRDALGRVGRPRPLYCNSRVLSTVPYFSTLFSEGFSEGQAKDINDSFPLDSTPYTDYYDYLSDSDLEDGVSSDEDEEKPHEINDTGEPTGSSSQLPSTPGNLPQSPQELSGTEDNGRLDNGLVRLGKVAIIGDMAAITLEATIYYLYTGKITFAPLSSDERYEVPAEDRLGNWNLAKIPCSSAKSIYRLADKYDIPTLKEQAKVHIHDSLEYCNIVDEVFSSFSLSFSEILSVQVSRLVSKIKEESADGAESITRKQLREKIAFLSPLQLARAADALAMIWDGLIGSSDLPATEPKSASVKFTEFSKWSALIFPLSSNWQRMKLALLKSIPTGTFIDVQFYAYNAIRSDRPINPKPLFVSSIVIEEWAPAITTHSQAAPLVDRLTDDYECWRGEIPETTCNANSTLTHQTEVAAVEGCEVVMLMSGAWKTWMSLLSYVYTNEMNFAPLLTSTRDGNLVEDMKAQRQQRCSPRSMYSLTTALGTERIKEKALKDIQSKLTTSNIAQELFTSFAANHKDVMDMELQFLHKNFTEKNPKLLIDHIRKMASGEAPLFSTTLSLVYDKLVERIFTKPVASGSGPGKPTESKNQSVTELTPTTQPSNPAVSVDPSPTPSVPPPPTQQPSAPAPKPGPVPRGAIYLECSQCGRTSRMEDLYDGLRCPQCPPRESGRGRPYMRCPACDLVRGSRKDTCIRAACHTRFV